MNDVKREILKVIKEYSYEQGTFCRERIRSFVYVIFAAAWGFLLKENSSCGKFLLGLNMILGFGFFFCDVYYSYRFAKRTNRLHEGVLNGDIGEKDARDICNKWSDKIYIVLKCQGLFLILMVVGMASYVIQLIC